MKEKEESSTFAYKSYADIVRKEFDTAVRAVKATTRKANGPKIYDLIGLIRKRREAAVVSLFPAIQQRYADKYPKQNLGLIWARQNCAMGHSVDGIDTLYHISLGASLFILDELRRTKKLGEAFRYFPTDEDEVESVYVPEIFDPCHEEEVIQGMMYLIHERDERDNNFQWYINDVTAKRHETATTETFESVEITKMTNRQRFNAVMALVRPVFRDRAVNRFEEKMWDFLDRYFEGVHICESKARRLQDEVDALYERGRSLQEELNRQRQPLNLLTYKPPQVNLNNCGRQGTQETNQSLISELEIIASRGIVKQDQADDANDQKIKFMTMAHMLPMTDEDEIEESFNAELMNLLAGFEVDDPYEICFGYLCLIESGSDLPWLYNTAAAVLLAAAAKLPWTVEPMDDLIPDYQDNEESIDGEEDTPEGDKAVADASIIEFSQMEPLDWNAKKAELYALKYTQDALGVEGKEAPPRKVNLPQLIFNLTGAVMPRTVSDSADMAEEFVKSGFPTDAGPILEYYMQLASDAQFASKNWRYFLNSSRFQDISEVVLGKSEEPDDSNVEQTVEELKRQVKRLKSEKDDLRQALYSLSKELSHEKATTEKVLEETSYEHQELIDLRQIIFNQEVGTEPKQDDNITIQFPTNVQHRVVVFGGHETWLKAIRPMLPNVVFAGRETRPNANLIRNADVVWIQANAIAHKDYYKIIDVVRTNRVPVRYFQYASAEKCAVQIVREDKRE